jgi:hypothetical protein
VSVKSKASVELGRHLLVSGLALVINAGLNMTGLLDQRRIAENKMLVRVNIVFDTPRLASSLFGQCTGSGQETLARAPTKNLKIIGMVHTRLGCCRKTYFIFAAFMNALHFLKLRDLVYTLVPLRRVIHRCGKINDLLRVPYVSRLTGLTNSPVRSGESPDYLYICFMSGHVPQLFYIAKSFLQTRTSKIEREIRKIETDINNQQPAIILLYRYRSKTHYLRDYIMSNPLRPHTYFNLESSYRRISMISHISVREKPRKSMEHLTKLFDLNDMTKWEIKIPPFLCFTTPTTSSKRLTRLRTNQTLTKSSKATPSFAYRSTFQVSSPPI